MSKATLSAVVAAVAALALAAPAFAQESETLVEGRGYKIGEGTVLHTGGGFEAGVISNLFYEDESAISSAVLRLIGEIAMASSNQQRTSENESTEEGQDTVSGEGRLDFRGGLRLTYNEYPSSNDAAQSQRSLGIGLGVKAQFFPQGRFTFGVAEDFVRDTRPINVEAAFNAARDVNDLQLWLRYRPVGRTISGTVRYENRLDLFEDAELGLANRMHHNFGLRVDWRFLPITLFYFDATFGIFNQLGDSTHDMGGENFKVSSYPLRLQLGAASAITEITTARLWVGYGQGFYASGPDYAGLLLGAEFGYRYSPLGRFVVGFEHDFRDSINANFYTENRFRVGVTQQIGRITGDAKVGLGLRTYRGVPAQLMGSAPDRSDVILSGQLSARYHYRDWIAATADYLVDVDSTDYRYTIPGVGADDPGFVRHEVTVGVRASF